MRVTIIGWISRSRFLSLCQRRDFGFGPRVAVDPDQLHRVNLEIDVDDDLARDVANRRNSHKRSRGVADRKCDTRAESVRIDEDGICGELAVAQWLGVAIDDAIYHGSDGGYDLVSPSGRTVDVKATRKAHGRLFFNGEESFKADVAVLVVLTTGDHLGRTHMPVLRKPGAFRRTPEPERAAVDTPLDAHSDRRASQGLEEADRLALPAVRPDGSIVDQAGSGPMGRLMARDMRWSM